MNTLKRIIIAGGTGFLGKKIALHYLRKNWKVIILTRGLDRIENDIEYLHWDGKNTGPWRERLEGATALLNLSGQSVNCRYTKRNKAEILKSRVDPTHTLGEATKKLKRPPLVWLNASTATLYEHSLDTANDEIGGRIGKGFSVSIGRAWETAFFEAEAPRTRKVALRTSMVLGHAKNSVYPVFKRLIRFGAGGKMGNGKQMVSWIHQEDFIRAVDFLIENNDLNGAFNITAPAPLANEDFMKVFRKALHIPFGLPAPEWLLKIGAHFLGTEPELVLKSRYVLPKRLLENRFIFKYPFLDEALQNL